MLACVGIFGAMISFEAYATCLSALKQSRRCASNRVTLDHPPSPSPSGE